MPRRPVLDDRKVIRRVLDAVRMTRFLGHVRGARFFALQPVYLRPRGVQVIVEFPMDRLEDERQHDQANCDDRLRVHHLLKRVVAPAERAKLRVVRPHEQAARALAVVARVLALAERRHELVIRTRRRVPVVGRVIVGRVLVVGRVIVGRVIVGSVLVVGRVIISRVIVSVDRVVGRVLVGPVIVGESASKSKVSRALVLEIKNKKSCRSALPNCRLSETSFRELCPLFPSIESKASKSRHHHLMPFIPCFYISREPLARSSVSMDRETVLDTQFRTESCKSRTF